MESRNVEAFPEHKYAVVIEEVDVPLSPQGTNEHQEGKSLSECVKEIKYLKETVKQLISQVNKQNHVITGIKLGLRGAVLSLSSCYTEDKNDEDSFPNQFMEYSNDEQVITASEPGTDFDNELPPPHTNYDLSTQCEQIQDPLQDDTACSPISIENCISAAGIVANDPILIPSSFQAVIIQNEFNDEDDKGTIDNIDDEDDDEAYAPSETEVNSDQEFERETCEKQAGSSQSKGKTDHVEEEETAPSRDRFRCTKCPKNFTCKTRRTFRDHMRRYHSKDPHKCHLCEKAYVKKSSLAHHIHSVHKGNRLKCAYCPGSFVQLGKLRVHEKIHLIKDGPPLQCCEFCGMNFRTVKSLLAHLGAMHKDTDHKHYAIGVKAIKNKHITRKT